MYTVASRECAFCGVVAAFLTGVAALDGVVAAFLTGVAALNGVVAAFLPCVAALDGVVAVFCARVAADPASDIGAEKSEEASSLRIVLRDEEELECG